MLKPAVALALVLLTGCQAPVAPAVSVAPAVPSAPAPQALVQPRVVPTAQLRHGADGRPATPVLLTPRERRQSLAAVVVVLAIALIVAASLVL